MQCCTAWNCAACLEPSRLTEAGPPVATNAARFPRSDCKSPVKRAPSKVIVSRSDAPHPARIIDPQSAAHAAFMVVTFSNRVGTLRAERPGLQALGASIAIKPGASPVEDP